MNILNNLCVILNPYSLFFLLPIYYFEFFNWIQKNSNLILLNIVSLLPFFLFLLLTVPDSDNFEKRINVCQNQYFLGQLAHF